MIRKLLFGWYYKRVPEHFHQWGFKKSVKLLIENYVFDQKQHEKDVIFYKEVMKRNDKLHAELNEIKLKQVANPEQVKWANEFLGTKFSDSADN